MSGKSLSELQWVDDESLLLLEATQNLKAEEDYKGLKWKTKGNKYDIMRKLEHNL